MSRVLFQILDARTTISHIIRAQRPAAKILMNLGRHSELTYAMLDQWVLEDYCHQWRMALHELRAGRSRVCFVYGVHPPSIAKFVEVFIMWNVNGMVRCQQKIIDIVTLNEVSEVGLFDRLPEYSKVTAEGSLIHDDWEVSSSISIPFDFDKKASN